MNELTKKGAAEIRLHEGFRGRIYRCPAGHDTIGLGFTWMSDSFRDWWQIYKGVPFVDGVIMTRVEADDALIYIVDHEYGNAVNNFLGRDVPGPCF